MAARAPRGLVPDCRGRVGTRRDGPYAVCGAGLPSARGGPTQAPGFLPPQGPALSGGGQPPPLPPRVPPPLHLQVRRAAARPRARVVNDDMTDQQAQQRGTAVQPGTTAAVGHTQERRCGPRRASFHPPSARAVSRGSFGPWARTSWRATQRRWRQRYQRRRRAQHDVTNGSAQNAPFSAAKPSAISFASSPRLSVTWNRSNVIDGSTRRASS